MRAGFQASLAGGRGSFLPLRVPHVHTGIRSRAPD